jgi:DNA-binding transcriptional ArsR family regulator/DNA-binding XRE family transcriptional regulator
LNDFGTVIRGGAVMTNPIDRRAAKDALYEGFATIARALASGRRAEIVELLAQGERTVDEIAGELGQSVANTSHHLRTLARTGLLRRRRAGTHVHYRIASDEVLELWRAMRTLAAAQTANRIDAIPGPAARRNADAGIGSGAGGLTQAQLAELAGVSRQLVGAVEADRHLPRVDAAVRLAAALSTTVEELLAPGRATSSG